jgi:TIR domain
MRHIFISHVAEDTDVAVPIAQGLEAAGYQTWHYTRDSLPGVSYLVQTARAIELAQAVVVVISRQALGAHQVTVEVVRAHEGSKPFFPVLRDITHEALQQQPDWRQAMGVVV